MQARRTIFDAAESGDIAEARDFIASGSALDGIDHLGNTPLMRAAMNERKAFVDFFLAQDVRLVGIKTISFSGATILYYAVQHGWLDIVERSIALGLALVGRNASCMSALPHATLKNHRAIADLLLAQEACIEELKTPSYGVDVLYSAAQHGWLDMVELVIDLGLAPENLDGGSPTPLSQAFRCHKFDVVALLIKHCSNYDLRLSGTTQADIDSLIELKRADICLELVAREKNPDKKANLKTMFNVATTGLQKTEIIAAGEIAIARNKDSTWGRRREAVAVMQNTYNLDRGLPSIVGAGVSATKTLGE
ncbi:MAG: ankyrin repeat domain-containing protein [Gammaproteobacteria bacterium]|nr:ankyrin repeat domain-containing protein [Gammaproteobacteria bacterium]